MKETHGEKADAVDSASARVGPPIVIEPAPFPGMLGIGTPVEQVTATVPWKVKGYHLSDDQKTFQYRVGYTDVDGVEHEHFFTPDQIKEVSQ